jgi:predicted RNA-binding Zn-ribbon protein involved in translation (DUF1610 family)
MTDDKKPGCLAPFLRLFQKTPRSATQDEFTPFSLPADKAEVLPYFLRDDFLSAAEGSFYRVLKSVVGDNLIICPKVSLADIFYVSRPDIHMAYVNKINRKHVDFVLCNPETLKPVIAIELDDASHRRPDRIERDEFVDQVFTTGGLPLLHVPVQRAYSAQELKNLLRQVFAGQQQKTDAEPAIPVIQADTPEPPLCPNCGERMVLRTAQRGSNAGQQFYGCPNYPKCQKIIALGKKERA